MLTKSEKTFLMNLLERKPREVLEVWQADAYRDNNRPAAATGQA